jgi:hypothetical protein
MVDGDVMTPTEMMLGCGMPGPDGSFQCSGSGMTSMPNEDWTLESWMMNLDPDPTVFANTVIRNNTLSTQTFFLNVVLPISVSLGPPLFISGSIAGGVTDSDGVLVSPGLWAQAADAGVSIYQAAIDNVVVQTLLDPSVTANVTTQYFSATIPPSGFSSVALPTATATTNIAIFLRFNLSPGDSVGFTSVFNVIPEPSTAVLAGFGLLGLLAAGRRAKARR